MLRSYDFRLCFGTTNALFLYMCTDVLRLLTPLKCLKMCVIQVGSRTGRRILVTDLIL
jgi:hypothetical protein